MATKKKAQKRALPIPRAETPSAAALRMRKLRQKKARAKAALVVPVFPGLVAELQRQTTMSSLQGANPSMLERVAELERNLDNQRNRIDRLQQLIGEEA